MFFIPFIRLKNGLYIFFESIKHSLFYFLNMFIDFIENTEHTHKQKYIDEDEYIFFEKSQEEKKLTQEFKKNKFLMSVKNVDI